MRIENVILALKASQYTIMESAFKTPPQNYEAFKERLGMWNGINEALRVIEAEKKELEND